MINLKWCSRCLTMSTRPRINFNADGLCDVCVWSEEKKLLDWKTRDGELITRPENNRLYEGKFDCLVSVSGGKDGSYVASFGFR